MVFKMCDGISCSSFSVKELDVIALKNILMVVEVGTRHSHQILLDNMEHISANSLLKTLYINYKNLFANYISR